MTRIASDCSVTWMNTTKIAREPSRADHAPQRSQADLLATLAPVIFLLLWSSGFAVAKVGLQHTQPLTFLTLRYGIIVLIFLPAFLLRRPPRPASPTAWLHVAVVGLLIQFAYFGLAYVGMSLGVSAGVAAVITSAQPLVVALAAPFVTAERVGARRWTGLLIGAAGAITVVVAASSFGTSTGVGILLCVGSMVGMAAATLYQKRFPVTVHPITVNLIHYVVGFVTIAPLAMLREPMTVNWTPGFVAALGWIAIANSVVAVSLLLFMIGRSEASHISSLFFLVPPMAALFGWILFGETLSIPMVVGMLIATAGVWLVSRSA